MKKNNRLLLQPTTNRRFALPNNSNFVEPEVRANGVLKLALFAGFWVAFVFAFSMVTACAGGPPSAEEEKHTEFKLRKFSVSVLLFPEQITGSPRMNFNLNILEPSETKGLENFFKDLLYDGENAEEYKETLIGRYRDAYRNMRETVKKNPDMSPAAMDWEYTESMDIRTFSDHGMVINRKKNYYTGGAHSILEDNYYVVDLKKQKALAWEDLFTDPASPELYDLVLDGLRNYAGLEKDAPLSSGIYFENEPEISEIFFLTHDGLGFHWNSYEIGPYSAGDVEIIISWTKIRNLLNNDGLVILNDWLNGPVQ